jgi:hypothetical protein
MSNKKPLIVGGITVLVLATGWAAASYQAHRSVQAQVRAAMDFQDPKIPVRFANLRDESNFLHSKGEVDVLLHPQCDGASVPDQPVGHLRYDVEQGLNPFGAQRVRWTFDVQPKLASAPEAAAVVVMTVSGEGSVDRHGSTDQNVVFAFNEKIVPKEAVYIAPMHVALDVDGRAVHGDFTLPQVRVTDGKNGKVELDKFSARLETPDVAGYNATWKLGLEDVEGAEVSVHGLRVEASSKGDKDVMSLRASYRVASGKVSGKELKDLVLALSIDGLPVADLEQLGKANDARCNAAKGLTGPADAEATQKIVAHLLRHGFRFAIDQISGKVGDGSIDGGTLFEVRATPEGEPISTARALKASGHLRLAGADVMPPPAAMDRLVQQHFVVADGDGVKMAFDFTDGQLSLNGTPLQLPAVQVMQAQLDAKLAGLSGLPGGAAGGAAQGVVSAPAQ